MRKLAFQFPSMLSYYPGTQIRAESILQRERAAFYAAACSAIRQYAFNRAVLPFL